MSAATGNGYDSHRLDVVEADQRDLRQLVFELISEAKHVKELCQHNARALDWLIARAKAEDERAEKEDGNA